MTISYSSDAPTANEKTLQASKEDVSIFPLSFAQQRLWFLDLLEPGSTAYNIPSAVRIRGSLEVATLKQSFKEIVKRHESLRTTFSMIEGAPVQIIAPSLNLSLPVVDLTNSSGSEREDKARRLATEEARRPFDLALGPLLRAKLLRLGHEDHVLLLTMHHIVSDGWSMGVFDRELSILYQALTNGQPSPLPDLPIQYADFTVWQREWLQGEVLESQLSYWKKQLEGAPGVLNLPTDRPRPAVETFRGARQSLVLGKTLSDDLKTLSRQEGVTLFMTLLAAFKVLLHRYTSQDDIVVGSPIAGRNRIEVESLIGFFINTLVLRTELSGDPSFRELVRRVRKVALEAYLHEDLPFEKLVEELQPERNLSHNPLFQVMFVLQNSPMPALQLPGLTVAPLEIDSDTTKFDLTLSMVEDEEGLGGTLAYNTDLFDAITITRMAGHFQTLLEGVASNPEQRLSELPLLTQTERHHLLAEWNDTKKDYPQGQCIHELFEAQVERKPDAVAAAFEDEQLTYRQLNQRASKLAHYLRKLGVGPEVLVGICVERSLEMVVAILGVLKAGGAYVPLDPAYPKERLAFILEDAQVSVLLTQSRHLSQLPKMTADGRQTEWSPVISPRSSVICLDTGWEAIDRESKENPASGVTGDNLAYVIYTSGSTGKPKGVLIEHQQILNYVKSIQDRYKLEPGASYAMVQPLSVDSSQTVIFPPLISGGCLHVISEGRASDAHGLSEYFCRFPIDLLKIAPSHLAALQTSPHPEQLLPRRWLIIGGETSRRDWVEKLQSMAHCSIFNHYGPTEATVGMLTYQVREDQNVHRSPTVPIGHPLPNTQAYLLDRRLEPVPIGVPGELHIGGRCLARGYLKRPELTAEKFIPDPFSDEPGARLYKTGDLARYLSDGNIEFLGRTDDQTKIRGFRVEPGEVEAALADHPGVRRSVVLVREDERNEKRLVAYVVSNQESVPTMSDLRNFLEHKLPNYMVPSAFVLLDTLPRTPHGKVDRGALPGPDQTWPELVERYVAPRTPVEQMLIELWADVLKLERVGVHDNFFDLGGHSLLATQLLSRVRVAFQIELPLRSLFEGPTVAGVAKHIELARQGKAGVTALPIVPEAIDEECPLSFTQERFWFLDQLVANDLAYHGTYGFRLSGPLNIEALEQALTEIVKRHETLRTTFHLSNGKPVQVISEPRSLRLSILDVRQQTTGDLDVEVERLLENEHRRGFDLSADLLLRAGLLRLSTNEHVLFLNTHHIAWDHWCIELFFRELSVLYQAFGARTSSPLPELPIQYRHYAIWQRNMFQDQVLENHLAYWRRQLHDCPPVLHLPTDYRRPPVQTFRGDRVDLVVPAVLTDSLEALSRETGVTLFMTLLSAFKILLHRLTGQDDIVVGSPIAGRDRSETEDLIGSFLNTLVLRTHLSGNPTFIELLTRVREVALGAYDHRDLPFEKLVEELKPKRDLSRTPLFQVLFNMYSFPEAELDLEGLVVKRLDITELFSLYDLTLYVRESNNATHFSVVYNTDLFGRASMTHFLQQYKHLLEQIVRSPAQPIASYSLVTPEMLSLLPEPSVVLAQPPQQSVTSIFAAWAKRVPEHLAVSQGQQVWSYLDLAEQAEKLARVLVASGLERGEVVGVYGPPSFGLIASMIGTLLSGGVILPLDHNLPSRRHQLMLREARAKRLLYIGDKESDVEWLKQTAVNDIRFIDSVSGDALDAYAELKLPPGSLPEILPDDAAYIFFTSGTTGTPQGVLGCHKSLSHFLKWQRETFNIGPDDRVAQLTSHSFDVVLRDIFLPLTSGATLCVPETSDPRELSETLDWLEREKISVLHIVPTLAQSWLAQVPAGVSLSAMRWVFFAGEPLTDSLVRRWREAFPACGELVNLYGPTETTMAKCYYRIPAHVSPGLQPVGWPLPETQALVLTENNQLCGVNEIGEIVLRTPFRTLGFINAPEENQKRFVKNPFRDDDQDLLYFTGDAGRYRPDGTLEILARLDDQVKIRGVRVEPDEVAVTLARHPAVASCFALARKDELDQVYLVAYVVASKPEEATAGKLRSYLAGQLPAAMVPTAFVFLDCLPLTSNGKVDRKALPPPSESKAKVKESFAAPRTPVEQTLASIWAEVLQKERVGISDDFFVLGGHSLLATQVVSRIREAFKVELLLRTLFEKPTIEELAVVIVEKQLERADAAEVSRLLVEAESLSEEETERQLVEENG